MWVSLSVFDFHLSDRLSVCTILVGLLSILQHFVVEFTNVITIYKINNELCLNNVFHIYWNLGKRQGVPVYVNASCWVSRKPRRHVSVSPGIRKSIFLGPENWQFFFWKSQKLHCLIRISQKNVANTPGVPKSCIRAVRVPGHPGI